MSSSAGRWYEIDLQPEPWQVGTAYASRRGGVVRGGISPSEKLKAFEFAVRDELEAQDPEMIEGDATIAIRLWRQLGRGISRADATNMQKAIEDAMQGVLISNDRNVRSISTEIMRQDTDVDFPHISIYAGPYGVQPPLAIYNGEGMMSWGNPQSDPMKDVIRTFKTHYTDGVF